MHLAACSDRRRLRAAAVRIAARRGERPATPIKALRKLIVAERRDWSKPGAPRMGWKPGELWEVALALFGKGDLEEELGDVGYYVAQSWGALWLLYAALTPRRILDRAVEKFTRRAMEEADSSLLVLGLRGGRIVLGKGNGVARFLLRGGDLERVVASGVARVAPGDIVIEASAVRFDDGSIESKSIALLLVEVGDDYANAIIAGSNLKKLLLQAVVQATETAPTLAKEAEGR